MIGPERVSALIACDLDGTLLTAEGLPAPGIVVALADLAARGARLVVCTGRPLHGAAKAVATLHADPVAFVCYHGALVVDAATGDWLRHLTIPADAAAGIVKDARLRGLEVTLYEGDVRRELVADCSGAAPGSSAGRGITRLVLSGDETGVAAALPRLVASWGASTRSERVGGGALAILPANADKGAGLRLVAARLGVPRERILACGDSAADESLLRAAEVSIAVGDPPDPALAWAREHIAQDGLADLLVRRLDTLLRRD